MEKKRMEQSSISVLLIEDNPEFAQLVLSWLATSGGEVAFALSWADSLAGGLGEISRGGVDVVLLDLGLPDSDGLGTFAAIQKHAGARGIPIIVLSGSDTESLALQTIQEGAENYLVKGACNAPLLSRALRYAVAKHTAEVASRTRIVGVIGAKGGVGATTIACTLATELRVQTGKRVLLADLDVQAGLVAFMMGVDPPYSFQYAIANSHRLDQSCWNAIVARTPNDLHIAASPAYLGHDDVPAETIRQVIAMVQPFYDWVVLDLGRLNKLSVALLDRTNEVFVVTGTGMAALYEAKRAVGALAKAGLGGERIRLIVNQADQAPALQQRDMSSIFGIEVYAMVPQDTAELQKALLARKPPAETSALRKQMAEVARRLAGLPKKKNRSPLSQLLSLSERFHKSTAPDRTVGVG
jgi:Flp pilus assembly CpaE family ATPase